MACALPRTSPNTIDQPNSACAIHPVPSTSPLVPARCSPHAPRVAPAWSYSTPRRTLCARLSPDTRCPQGIAAGSPSHPQLLPGATKHLLAIAQTDTGPAPLGANLLPSSHACGPRVRPRVSTESHARDIACACWSDPTAACSSVTHTPHPPPLNPTPECCPQPPPTPMLPPNTRTTCPHHTPPTTTVCCRPPCPLCQPPIVLLPACAVGGPPLQHRAL